ncbi:hypothetical protein HK414_20010 [Ramlibacter terrae]|uniref:Uncharacterized protein n=1 Tax=Ramlibacter terrae TaxID=2732511 RepID=A0ABX6P6M5_9BURK|nr:hypothetical protein HK414_20010 [Ramlibacter terrae]
MPLVLPAIVEPEPEVPDDIVEPDDVEPVVEPLDMEPLVEPVEAVPEVLPVAAPPPGVPVAPIGVPRVLRWPAPTAALEAGAGGVPWAGEGSGEHCGGSDQGFGGSGHCQDLLFALWTGELPAKQD